MPGKFTFYAASIEDGIAVFDETEARHAFKTLRFKQGDEIGFSDGKGTIGRGTILSIDAKAFTCAILSKHSPERGRRLSLAIGLIKNNERLEWLVEKSTELGVMQLIFFPASNSEKRKLNVERLNKIAVSALKQSHAAWLPEIVYIDALNKIPLPSGLKLISHCREQPKAMETGILKLETFALIGPEGDFTAAEIDWAHENGFLDFSLGENILRTETAAITLASVHYLCCK